MDLHDIINENDSDMSLSDASVPENSPDLPEAADFSVDTDGDSFDQLDVSSLEDEAVSNEEHSSPEEIAHNAESLFHKTVSMMRDGELDTDSAIMLLQKSANDGCELSALFLGAFYSDPKSENYNPTVAYDNYLLSAQLGSADGCYKLGLCFSSGFGCDKSYDIAFDIFKRGAEADHPDCICALGICCEFGLGCPVDYSLAAEYYARAAEFEHPTAINNLGGLYFYGHGVEQDKEKAISLYKLASSFGSSNAECRLGVCFEEGVLGQADLSRAFEHYKRAAEMGNPIALYKLALCYDRGNGTEQNFAKAFKYYAKAAKAGNADAMYEAGKMSLSGRGTKKNLTAAYKMFLSASNTLAIAEYELGNCFFEGLGAVRNRASAYVHYLRAFEKDPTLSGAAYRLGLCRLKGLGCDKDSADAYSYFSKGADLGSTEAAYMKGECEYFGVGTQKDLEAAVSSYTRAISASDQIFESIIPAMISLGLCYERGFGVEKDPDAALKLYKKAAEFGNANAMYRVGHLMLTDANMKSEYSSARIYILRAARKNHLSAMLMMGRFSAEGKGVSKNLDDAIRWYTKAVSTEIPSSSSLFDFPERFETASRAAIRSRIEAQYRLGMILARHKPSSQSYIQAFECIALAASMGHKGAETEISKIFVSGGDLKAYYESPFSREDAAFSNGNTEPDTETLSAAMNKLGDALFDGKGMVSKNQTAAVRCYKTAAELGHTDAAYSYGWCLRHGAGVRENDVEAVKWLRIAADKGNANAAYSYGLCCEEGAGTGIKNRRDALSYYRKAAASGHAEAANRYIALSERDE